MVLMRPARPRTARVPALLAVLALLLLAGAVAPAPAAAATVRDVQLTQDGPVPAQLALQPGDRVRFVNTDTFVHRAVSNSAGWAFDTGTLVPGRSFTVEPALTRPGTYSYRGADLDRFEGSVVVTAAAPASSAPSRPSSPAPAPLPVPQGSSSPAASPQASPTAAPSSSPAPVATGGSGTVAGPPPLAGGSFGGFDGLAPTPSGAPAPQVAPDAPVDGVVPLPVGEAPLAAPSAGATAPTTALGDLPALASPVEARRLGLPLTLAALLVAGVASLLVRLLLAEAPRGPVAPA